MVAASAEAHRGAATDRGRGVDAVAAPSDGVSAVASRFTIVLAPDQETQVTASSGDTRRTTSSAAAPPEIRTPKP